MAHNPITTPYDDRGYPRDAVTTVAIAAAAAADTVVKAGAGRLCRVLVTAAGGAAATLIYDDPSAGSGVAIGSLPASVAVGSVYDFDMPAANGITVKGAATNPGMTISYS